MDRVLAGHRVALVAGPQHARGLAWALDELDVGVSLAVILRRKDSGEPGLEALEAQGAEVSVDPVHQEVVERLTLLAERGLCDAVVGAGMLRDAAERAGLAYVELTAPHVLEHFPAPTPYMGFEGLLRLAGRLAKALLERDHRRRIGR